MTLVEFLAPIKDGTFTDRVLGVLFFKQKHESHGPMTVGEIASFLKSARGRQPTNIPDVLSRCGHFVDVVGKRGNKSLWSITGSGENHVKILLGIPNTSDERQQDIATLGRIASTLQDQDVRDYVDEAIRCLQAGAHRAAVVFLWTGAIRVLQSNALAKGAPALNAAILRHDPKARSVSSIDCFSYTKDSTVLLAALDLRILDKSEKDTMKEGLDLRNRCGHPAKYKPGEKKVSSFIEDMVQIVFS